MKTLCILYGCIALSCAAQVSIGNFIGSRATPEPIRSDRYAPKLKPSEPPDWVAIGGKLYDKNKWNHRAEGHVVEKARGYIILSRGQDYNFSRIAVKNYSRSVSEGDLIYPRAKETGTIDWGGVPLEVWDCGTEPTPVELRKAAEEANEAQKAQNEIILKQKAVIQLKAAAADARAVKLNQEAADKGDAYGLFRMGERYLKGESVEKDEAKAKDYLQKAADKGNLSAKAMLDKLTAHKP